MEEGREGAGGVGGCRERQKVRGRVVLMAVCRAGLWGMQGLVGAERWVCGWMERGKDGVMEGVGR